MKEKTYEMDMTNGSLLNKIIIFSLPLILSNILQLLFNAADMVVVGRFVGHSALAAVGATSPLINLLLNLFIGFSVGVNVTVARLYGSNDLKGVSDSVHTSVALALISGTVLMIIGIFTSKPLLVITGTPDEVLDQAALYMEIYFAGMPVTMLYNFGASILRSVGDTKRPLYYLIAAGITNVILNVIFVTQIHMGVEGVALATVISQILSAALILKALIITNASYKLNFKNLKINKNMLKKILKIGVPSGIQGITFSLSNVLIQSSINIFGSIAIAGNTAGSSIEGFIYVAMNSVSQAALSFVSQNFGAHKFDRIKRSVIQCSAIVVVLGIFMGFSARIFGYQLLGIYSGDAEVIQYGIDRMTIIALSYFLCGLMDVFTGSLRGLGYSFIPMLISILGACGLRILWIFTIFNWNKTLTTLYISYPVSWLITMLCEMIFFVIIFKKEKKKVARYINVGESI